MYSMAAGDGDECRRCAQWTQGSTWTDSTQTAIDMEIMGTMMIAIASIMERICIGRLELDSSDCKVQTQGHRSAHSLRE